MLSISREERTKEKDTQLVYFCFFTTRESFSSDWFYHVLSCLQIKCQIKTIIPQNQNFFSFIEGKVSVAKEKECMYVRAAWTLTLVILVSMILEASNWNEIHYWNLIVVEN